MENIIKMISFPLSSNIKLEKDLISSMTLKNELKPENSSEYLAEGFAKDRMRIHNVAIDLGEGTVLGKLDLERFYEPHYNGQPDVGFHLSALTAYRFVNQLIVAYACRRLGKPKAELGEFFEISHQMRIAKPVAHPTDISAIVKCIKDIPRGDSIFGDFEFDIENGSFYGSIRGVVKQPQ